MNAILRNGWLIISRPSDRAEPEIAVRASCISRVHISEHNRVNYAGGKHNVVDIELGIDMSDNTTITVYAAQVGHPDTDVAGIESARLLCHSKMMELIFMISGKEDQCSDIDAPASSSKATELCSASTTEEPLSILAAGGS